MESISVSVVTTREQLRFAWRLIQSVYDSDSFRFDPKNHKKLGFHHLHATATSILITHLYPRCKKNNRKRDVTPKRQSPSPLRKAKDRFLNQPSFSRNAPETRGKRPKTDEDKRQIKNEVKVRPNGPQIDRGPCLSPCRSPSSFRDQRPTSALGDSSPRWLRDPASVRCSPSPCINNNKTSISSAVYRDFI